MIGKYITPILIEIENTIFSSESDIQAKPNYGHDGFRAAVKIFMSVMLDKMYELQNDENLSFEDRSNMATNLGYDLRKLIKTYTDIDTHTLYNDMIKCDMCGRMCNINHIQVEFDEFNICDDCRNLTKKS